MAAHDLLFRTGGSYDTAGKNPYVQPISIDLATGGYVDNSLEGHLFDNMDPGGADDGKVDLGGGFKFTPNFDFLTQHNSPLTITNIVRTNATTADTVKVTTSAPHSLSIGDYVSINGVTFDGTHPEVNGVWKVSSTPGGSEFWYIQKGPDLPATAVGTAYKHYAFNIYDNRAGGSPVGRSYNAFAMSPRPFYTISAGQRRIAPSDVYVRFKIAASDGVSGGFNPNIFSVVDTSNNNIKPVIWAYFFNGVPMSGTSTRTPQNIFDIIFNSYAIVLRPTGDGSYLEFALVKFNWGVVTAANWFNDYINSALIKQYTVNSTDLGYLISSNPTVAVNISGNPVVTEIAKSNSFLYDSNFATKFNLKITIRKHSLTDSLLDNTYLVNLLINDDYNQVGDGFRYSSMMHGFIQRSSIKYFAAAGGGALNDYRLLPYFYFKFINLNQNQIGAASSKISVDSLLVRQLNASAGTSYLY